MNGKRTLLLFLSLFVFMGCTAQEPGRNVPPRITTVSPSPEEELALDGTVTVYFDQPMDQSRVEVSTSPALKLDLHWVDASTLEITPADLSRAYPYSFSVTGQSQAGIKLEEDPAEFEINTIGLLRVAEVVPSHQSAGIELGSTITVFFNRPVVPLTVLDRTGELPQPLHFEPDIPGEGEWVNTSIYTWRPRKNMVGGRKYVATLDALSSADGAEMLEPMVWEFTTMPPQVNGVMPWADSVACRPDQQIAVRFNQPMDRASVEDAFTLVGAPIQDSHIPVQPGQRKYSGTFKWDKESTGFTFTPEKPLNLQTKYTATLAKSAGAAGGGIAMADHYRWSFTTVLYPRIVATLPVNGAVNVSPFIPGIKIGVTAPLDEKTLQDRMTISPQPPGDVRMFVYNSSTYSDITLQAILDDHTRYTVTLLPGVGDPYGNVLNETFTFTFTTGEYPPQFSVSPDEWFSILDTRQTTDLLAFIRNIDEMDYQLYRLPETNLPRLSSWGALKGYRPSQSRLYRKWSVDTSIVDENTGYSWRVPLSEAPDKPISPGVYLFVASADEIEEATTRLIILANANIVTKHSLTQAMAWVTDLRSGKPLAGVEVTFYYEGRLRVGQAVTDQDGIASISYPDHGYTELKDITAVARSNDVYGITYSQWGTDAYQYVSRYYDPYVIFPYTDRPIYRPGHEVFFKAIVRERDDASYRLPGEQEVLVSVTNSSNDEIFRDTYTVSESGSIDGSFVLDPEAATGRYYIKTIVHWGKEKSSENIVWFQVAEYERPDFEASLIPNKPEVVEDDDVTINVDAHYFFGGAVQTGMVRWDVFSQPYYFHPDLPGRYYSFIDYDHNVPISADYIAGYGQQIIEGESSVNDDGTFSFEVPTELVEFPASQRFTIEATVDDGSGQFVNAATEVVVHKGDAYPGVRPGRYLNQVGEPSTIELIAVGSTGKTLPGQTVQVEVIQTKHYSVKELSPDRRTYWKNTTEDISVLARDVVMDGEGVGVLAFTPLEAGSYKIIASTADDHGRTLRSSAYLWATGGKQFVSWGQPNSNSINLVPDKTDYRPGDIAEILIPVPYAGNDIRALVTVERNNVLMHEVLDVDTNSFVYKLPIQQSYAPNVYFSVILIKGADASTPLADFCMSSIRLDVDTSAYELDVRVTADVPDASPGDQVTYRVEARDAGGDPVQAEVSFALVDLATLKLSPPNTGPLMDTFYRSIPPAVWSSLSLVYLAEPIPDELFDQAKGGGGGSGDAFYDLRRDFRDTAYWNATVLTGEDGTAEVTVTLPDNLTTWNMDVRAITPDGKVGQTTHELVSTEKLLIRPVTPRFFVVGDELTLAALAYNNTKKPLEAVISMVGEGYTLKGGSEEVDFTIPAGGVVRAEWPVTIDSDVEWIDLTFAVDAGELVDATKPPIGDPAHDHMLPVYRYNVPETVATAGQLSDAGTRTETISLPPDVTVDDATIDITLDYSLAGSMTEGLTWLENYPHECTEQTVSRFLANAHTMRILRKLDLARPELEAKLDAQIGQALQRLYAQQHADGGWGWFVSDASSDLITAYVLHGLVTAKEAGYDVDKVALDRAVSYLSKPPDPANTPTSRNRQAYNLYVVARAGKPDPGRVMTLYDARNDLDIWAKALLAQTIWLVDPTDPRLEILQSDFVNDATISAGGVHWSEDAPDMWNWTTDTRTTAMVLDTFALIWPKHELNPSAVRWLMAARQHDRWETTQETTWAIVALGDWMAALGDLTPEYDWKLSLNQDERLSGSVAPEQALESTRHTVDLEDILKANNALSITRGRGRGNLYYTAQLNTVLPVEEVEPASKGYVVTRRYLDEDGKAVESGGVGDIVMVELTLIVRDEQYYVYVEDAFPAGAEGIDTSLLTESGAERPKFLQGGSSLGWGWWWFGQIQIRDEKATLYAERLPAGTYIFSYQLRLGIPGQYHVLPAVAQNFYFPDVYGRTDGTLFIITP